MRQLQLNLYEKVFNNKQVRFLYDKNQEIWCVGIDVAKILEYKQSRQAIYYQVANKYKISYGDSIQKNASKILTPSLISKQC